jgi:hypothetical protein
MCDVQFPRPQQETGPVGFSTKIPQPPRFVPPKRNLHRVPLPFAHQIKKTPPVLGSLIGPPHAAKWSSSRTRAWCGSRATSARTSAPPTTRRPSPTATAATPAAPSGPWSSPATSTSASSASGGSTSAPPTPPRRSTQPRPAAGSCRACHPRPTTAPSSGRRAGRRGSAAPGASRFPGHSAASSAPASGRRRGTTPSPSTSRSDRRRARGWSRSSRRSRRRRRRPAAPSPATLGWRRPRRRWTPRPAPSSGYTPPRYSNRTAVLIACFVRS